MKLICFCAILSLPFVAFGQKDSVNYILYMEAHNSAEFQYEYKKSPAKALNLLKEAEKIHPLYPIDAEMKANCYLDLGDTALAIQYLEKSIQLGNPEIRRIQIDFKKLNARSMNQVLRDYPTLVKNYYCGKDISLMLEINTMVANDQLIRNYHETLDEHKSDWLFTKIDSSNINRLKEIYNTTGVLPPAFIIYWHCFIKYPTMWEYFEPEMKKGIFNGTFQPQPYAMIYDRVRVIHDQKNSWYGEYTDSDSGEGVGGPVDDIEHLDERRKAIGLRPMSEMNQIWGWKLPPGYVPPSGKN